jgi:IS30 family transposase
MVWLLYLPRRDSDALHRALLARMTDMPPLLLRSITWDQGTEMARHLTITRSLVLLPRLSLTPAARIQRGRCECVRCPVWADRSAWFRR